MVAGTAVMPSSHVTVEGPGEIHVESSTRYSRGGREESGRAARNLARWEKRNGLAIRMRDVPTKVSFRPGINGSPAKGLSGENEFRAVRKRCCHLRRFHLIARLIAPATVHVATGRAPPSR